MKPVFFGLAIWPLVAGNLRAADFVPAPQAFRQEVASRFSAAEGLPAGPIQLLAAAPDGRVRAFAQGNWYEFRDGRWQANPALAAKENGMFVFPGADAPPLTAPIPWREVRQIVRSGTTNFLAIASPPQCLVVPAAGAPRRFFPPGKCWLNQLAVSPEGVVQAAFSDGLYELHDSVPGGWVRVRIPDGQGRAWGEGNVLGVTFDSQGRLWVAMKAGVACRTAGLWHFFEGKDGLPWNDFTGAAAGPGGEVWFTTHLGVIRFDGKGWHYRQGTLWLPHDDVSQAVVDGSGRAWFATAQGVGLIERRRMTLAEKAELYEQEIEKYVKRTPYGYVAQAPLGRPGDRSSAAPRDDDNDGLWTSMYGAGEAFDYAATKDPKAKERAKQAFEALRFLQKVTQGGEHAPPKGYVARSILPVDGPDPNVGRLAADREAREHDSLWKLYEPRWPKSADGKWYWKSDTSSDELDGHYFFYPIYFDLCADTDAERDRVREVVRDLTDHLVSHGFRLVDFDGKPTRWGLYDPEDLEHNPLWWQERGLKSLSMLSYLAGAEHVTGDAKYGRLARELIDRYAYAHNAMHCKEQYGPGSGNESDNEMAFMSYYNLLRFSKDEDLKKLIRYSFFHYWLLMAPEMNPFFNFAYAGQNLSATATSPWGPVTLAPRGEWFDDALATLYGFPLDRLNWPHRNAHRLDLRSLTPLCSEDVDSPDEPGTRGYRVNGKVLPVENRFFGHWNTDPWRLDYPGKGDKLGAGTVFLLPYYLGLYHGFIQKP